MSSEEAKKRAALAELEKLGLEVFAPDADEALDWSSLAGYEDLVEEVEST